LNLLTHRAEKSETQVQQQCTELSDAQAKSDDYQDQACERRLRRAVESVRELFAPKQFDAEDPIC
jgi:hypothetical protein